MFTMDDPKFFLYQAMIISSSLRVMWNTTPCVRTNWVLVSPLGSSPQSCVPAWFSVPAWFTAEFLNEIFEDYSVTHLAVVEIDKPDSR